MKTIKELIKSKPPESELHKLTRKIADSLGMIWLTMVAYIIYVEFFKDILTIL